MEALKLLDAAPFKADVIEALKQAFDEAWASIVHSIDPAAVENARLSLAHAIIAHMGLLGTDDLAVLKAAAFASFEKNGIALSRMSFVDSHVAGLSESPRPRPSFFPAQGK